jgi:hypothetical protein
MAMRLKKPTELPFCCVRRQGHRCGGFAATEQAGYSPALTLQRTTPWQNQCL